MASRRVSRALFVPSPRPGAAAAGPSAAAAASVPAAHAYSLRTRSAPSTAPRSDEDEPEDIKPKGKGRQKDGADDAAYSDSAVKRAAPSASPAKRRSSASASPNKKIAGIKRAADSPEPLSPRKTKLPPKLELSQEETLPPPPHWEETLRVLSAQRTRIVAPVDTMGCEENGREERRADAGRERESDEEEKKRERLAVLIGLMLSSQTKDPVTAAAVRALQTGLPGGLHLDALLTVSPELLNGLISKVGFHNRKTHYIRSVAALLASDFGGDVPRTLADLCSLPGVGPKMAFLALQGAWGENVGIGVDTHVHRLTNRLGWGPTKDAEGTRLRLQSFLPKSLHRSINKTLVGFGQIICVPIGPRCDLCDLAPTGLCPSVRTLDPKRAAARVKVELLPLAKEEVKQEEQLEAEAEQQIRAGGVKKEKLAW